MTQYAPRKKRAPAKKPKAAPKKPHATPRATRKPAEVKAAKAKPEKPGTAAPKFKVPPAALVPWMAMTGKQQAFVAAYVKTGNAETAAQAAYGKSESGASRLRDKHVAAFLKALEGAVEQVETIVADAAWIKERFILEATSALEGAVRIRALENLAELLSMYPAKHVKVTPLPAALDDLKAAIAEFDGADTGLPSPHGQRAH